MTAADIVAPVHPYFPEDVILSASFIPNDWNLLNLISAFAVGWAIILSVTLTVVRKLSPKLKVGDQGLVLWFVLTGSIHVFFEGYFVYNHSRMASRQDFFGQLWKEYALSDSRYLSSDPFLLCIETWTTTTWGPFSLLTAILIATSSPYRHPIQALVSTGQFYGNLLYFSTSLVEDFSSGKKYYRPEPFYFWIYFVLMNSIWLVIPGYCLYSSIKASARAFAVEKKLKVSDGVKKRV